MKKDTNIHKTGRWLKPQVTRVKLDPTQAVLQQCKAAEGIWLDRANSVCKYLVGGKAGTVTCGYSVRGRRTATRTRTNREDYYKPS